MMDTAPGKMSATTLRVRYAETDAMGVVYYANYLVWFELGRTEWIRTHGISYRELEEQGVLLPVTKVTCTYRQSARYDDLVRIETTVTRFTRASVTFHYQVFRAEPHPELLLTEGSSEHVFLSRAGKIVRLDPQSTLWQALHTVANGNDQ